MDPLSTWMLRWSESLRGFEFGGMPTERRSSGSEDFEDLLIETLQRVAAERDESKRQAYRNILLNAVRDAESYDETLRFLRVLEQLQPNHVEVLRRTMRNRRSRTR